MSWIDRIKAPKIATGIEKKSNFPEGLWTKCQECSEIVFQEDLEKNLLVCPKCQYHFRLKARKRLDFLLDVDGFKECDVNMTGSDPLGFKDLKRYKDRIRALEKSGFEKEAYIYGHGNIKGLPIVIGTFVFEYMGGSMGSVVGEKLTRTFELAEKERKPCIVITASGGARMQEGIFSLMQMAKTVSALGHLKKKGIPYIVILTDPTTGGVAASCAMLGDLIFSEPNALIGFAGPRVIEQTIKEKLPPGFQHAEFLLEHGMIDRIVPRAEMRETLCKTLSMLGSSKISDLTEMKG